MLNQSIVLTGVVNQVKDKSMGLIGAFFTKTTRQPTKKIATDIDNSLPAIAPVMSDKERGKVLPNTAHVTKILQAAFSRLSDVVDVDKVLLRQSGQKLGGAYDNTKAVKLAMIETMKESIQIRQKKMAADALFKGKVEAYDEDTKSVKEIDFKRAASLSTSLTGADAWTLANKDSLNIVNQIEGWDVAIKDESGADGTTLVLDPKAWSVFRQNKSIKEALDTRRGSGSEMETACNTIGNIKYVGSLGTVNVVVYSEKYTDSKGVKHPMLPANSAILLDEKNLMGVLHYGVLKDQDTVIDSDFIVREVPDLHTGNTEIVVESRYLPVPHNINATFAATVA